MVEINKIFTSDKSTSIYVVDEGHTGMRLDAFLMSYWPTVSREHIKRKITKSEVVISGTGRTPPHKASCKVYKGETITIVTYRSTHEDEYWRGKKVELDLDPPIIFEDEHIVVISKPPFMSTHPTGKHLFYCATVLLGDRLGIPIHAIHRIDRETSGILILGKHSEVSSIVSTAFEEKRARKCYFLIAEKKKATIEFPFTARERLSRPDETVRRVFIEAFPPDAEEGKDAETLFEKLVDDGRYILALAFPRTGRQHQIRVHAAAHGFPLVGDKIYNGGEEMFGRFKDGDATQADFDRMQLPRHALHSVAAGFHYPYLDKDMTFIAPLPKDFVHWIKKHVRVEIEELQQDIAKRVTSYFEKATPTSVSEDN